MTLHSWMMKLHTKNDTITHKNIVTTTTSKMKSKVEKRNAAQNVRVYVCALLCVNHTHMFIDCDVGVNQSSCTHDCAQF